MAFMGLLTLTWVISDCSGLGANIIELYNVASLTLWLDANTVKWLSGLPVGWRSFGNIILFSVDEN